MTRSVRGPGVLAANRIAEVNVPENQAQQIKPGQIAQLDTRNGLVRGKVRRVLPGAANGLTKVEVQIEDALPPGAVPGLNIDGIVELEVLKDVVYVGRPAMGSAESGGVLFKLAGDGQQVTKVNVQFGRAGMNIIQVLNGLEPGDQVILSDMSAFAAKDRVRLR